MFGVCARVCVREKDTDRQRDKETERRRGRGREGGMFREEAIAK